MTIFELKTSLDYVLQRQFPDFPRKNPPLHPFLALLCFFDTYISITIPNHLFQHEEDCWFYSRDWTGRDPPN